MKKLIKLNLALISLIGSTFAMANQEETHSAQASISGFYIGAGYGTFDAVTDNEWDNTYRYGRLVEKTSGDTTKLYAGYAFNRIISIEASYSDYGDTLGVVNIGFNAQAVNQSPKAISIAANAGYSFDNGWRAFGLLGLSSVDLNSSYDYLDTDSPTAIKWGFGGEYTPAGLKGFQLRLAFEADTYFAEAERYFADDDLYAFSLTSIYVGASYKF
jgi:hypothetical protein